MRKLLLVITAIVVVLAVASLVPTLLLYLKPPAPIVANNEAIAELEANDGKLFRFVVFGDTHNGFISNDSATLKIVGRINREDRVSTKAPVDFALLVGDATFWGKPWGYEVFNKIRSMVGVPVICAVGNHDDHTVQAKEYFKKYVGEKNFSFTDRNAYFISIDNAISDISNPQFAWLEEELRKSAPYAHRFVIAHRPPFSPDQRNAYRPESKRWSYRFMKLCEEHKVDMVFTGHEHMYHEAEHGGVRYITTGGAAFSLIPWWDGGCLHYVVVRVYGDYVDHEVRKVFPPFWEFLCYYMWRDLYYYVKDMVA